LTDRIELAGLPQDSEALKAVVLALMEERDRERQRAEEQARRAEEHKLPADQLASSGELAQMLLDFACELDRKPVQPEDPPKAQPTEEIRRVRRRRGRRNLAAFEHLPVTTHVHELSVEERACPGCGCERREIGAEESWQIEYFPGHVERIQHLRKKYACPACENAGAGFRIETAAKPETVIEKGLAGPGLLA
jgi:transposase